MEIPDLRVPFQFAAIILSGGVVPPVVSLISFADVHLVLARYAGNGVILFLLFVFLASQRLILHLKNYTSGIFVPPIINIPSRFLVFGLNDFYKNIPAKNG